MIPLLESVEECFHSGRDRIPVKESFHRLNCFVVVNDTVRVVSDYAQIYIVDDGASDCTLILEFINYFLDLLIGVMVVDIVADDVAYGECQENQKAHTGDTKREMRCDESDHILLTQLNSLGK